MSSTSPPPRDTIFVSKATPGDDAFTLWLAPRLEAAGYKVFADILNLEPGDGWRLKITNALQHSAIKMLLCCSDQTLQRPGVIEEIEIGSDLVKSLNDPNFIIPLKIQRYKKLFGIGSKQYVDFEHGWANGLIELLQALERQNVPKVSQGHIHPNWALYQRRRSITLRDEPETLTSNWLRILSVPDDLRFVKVKGFGGHSAIQSLDRAFPYAAIPHAGGFLTFASPLDFEEHLSGIGRFEQTGTIPYSEFVESGWEEIGIEPQESSRMIVNLLRQSWEQHCKREGFLEREYANGLAQVVSDDKIGIGRHVSWGRQGQVRRSMLRNIARGKVWEYGVSAQPSLFPFPHYRLKSRVLFSEADGDTKGVIIADHRTQHRLRRSICSGWRNKQWHGRLMAFIELLAGDSPYVSLAAGANSAVLVDGMPIQGTSPVTARQTNRQNEDEGEPDESTVAGYLSEDDI